MTSLLKTVAFLSGEVVLVAAAVCLLFRFRRKIGLTPLCVFIGSYQYLQTVLAATVYLPLFSGYTVSPGSAVLFTSSLFAILLVYLREDVPETRRVIYGIVISNLTLTCLSLITHWQMASGVAINLLHIPPNFFQVNPRIFLTGTLVLIADAILVIVTYEYLFFSVKRLPLFLRIATTLLLVISFDSIAFTMLAFGGAPSFGSIMGGQLVGKGATSLLFSVILYLYLRTGDENETRDQPATEIGDVFSILTYRERYELERLQREEQERKHAAETDAYAYALKVSEERYRRLFETSKDGIALVDPGSEKILDANRALTQLSGYEESELHGKGLSELISDIGRNPSSEGFPDFQALDLQRADGSVLPVEFMTTSIRVGEEVMLQCHFRDRSEKVRAEQQLIRDAFYDRLTALPNRALFLDRVERLLANQKRNSDQSFAVFFLDVDRFKNVNDSLGHAAGDRLLVAIGQRLQGTLRATDTIARLGGDEFGIILSTTRGTSEARQAAQRMESALREPFVVDSIEITATVSIGIVMSAPSYSTPEEIIRDADTAMYNAKAQGRSRHELFDAAMHERVVATLTIENRLRGAVSRGEIMVHYQPIVDIESGTIVGAEALVRWASPDGGVVSPVDFIPIAEETGLIVEIGEHVLRTAAAQAGRWIEELGRPIRLSVNVSMRQLQEQRFSAMVGDVLRDSRLAAAMLNLEITESALMDDFEATRRAMDETRALGVGFAIDDFGTGWSSLSYLRRLPIDMLKVDRSFVADSDGADGGTITAAIISLANSLGIEAVAEGVETTDQLGRLRALRCRYAQGYLLARPADAVSIGGLLRENRISIAENAGAIQ